MSRFLTALLPKRNASAVALFSIFLKNLSAHRAERFMLISLVGEVGLFWSQVLINALTGQVGTRTNFSGKWRSGVLLSSRIK
jgi:hypothetical protein